MSSSLRYKNEEIRQHLASQYVLGLLSRRVTARCETLMRQDPEFEKAVYDWQQRMNKMNANLTPMPVPDKVWQGIEQQLDGSDKVESKGFNPLDWLSNVMALRSALAIVLCFSLFMFFTPEGQQPVTASYIALMGSEASQDEPSLVVSAYKGANPGESNLRFQWNDRNETVPLAQLGVIAIDRESGKATYLGSIADAKAPMFLNKPEWLAVKNSAELLIVKGSTAEDPIVFRGPCIQLGQWI